MSTFLFNFKPQFAALVKSGKKRQTVRANRADGRVPRPGDIAKLYSGLRTCNTRLLLAADIIACDPVRIDFEERAFVLGGERLRLGTLEQFAKEDGFANATEMLDWFKKTHGPDDFEGFCVRWDPGSP